MTQAAEAARTKQGPGLLGHAVEQQRVTYSQQRHREARHRAAIEASIFAGALARSPLASPLSGGPRAVHSVGSDLFLPEEDDMYSAVGESETARAAQDTMSVSTSTPEPLRAGTFTPYPRGRYAATPGRARRVVGAGQDDDAGSYSTGQLDSAEASDATRSPGRAAMTPQRRCSPGSRSRPPSSADMFSSAVAPDEEAAGTRRRRRLRPPAISTRDSGELPLHLRLAWSPYGPVQSVVDQRVTLVTPPARAARRRRQAAASAGSVLSPPSSSSPGTRMQHLRAISEVNRERVGGGARAKTAPAAADMGAGSAGSTAGANPLSAASAASALDRQRQELIRGVLAESHLLAPLLTGDKCLGRVKLPLAMLMADASAGNGGHGLVHLPIHAANGRPLLGLDGQLSTVAIRWKDADKYLSVSVESAAHLPKVCRFGLCDTQVTVECGLYKFVTEVVRGSLDPVFDAVYHFPKPLMLAAAGSSPASQHLLVSVLHVDGQELLDALARQCLIVAAERGAHLLRRGEHPMDHLLVLASGTVGVWSTALPLKGAGSAGHADDLLGSRGGKDSPPHPRHRRGSLPKGSAGKLNFDPCRSQAEPEELAGGERELTTVSAKGACFGDLALLAGHPPRYSLVANSDVRMVHVPREAISWLLHQKPDLAEQLAHVICRHREDAYWAKRGATIDVHVHLHGISALPDFVDLNFGKCDPTAFVQVQGQRASTSSQRFLRQRGNEPRWNQTFSFCHVPYEVGAGGSAMEGGASARGCNAAQALGLQLIVCEVDALGQLDYILGTANLSLPTLVRTRRLAGDIALTMLEPDQLAPVLYHNDRPSRPASAHSSIRPASAGAAKSAAANSQVGTSISAEGSPPAGDPPCSPDIYEDDEDSGGEEGRAAPAGAAGAARKGVPGEAHAAGVRGSSGRRSGGAEGREVAGGKGAEDGLCGGKLMVDVRVEGCYAEGEKDLLQALRTVGLETSFTALRSGGIKSVEDLVTNPLDEMRLSWLCPHLSAAKRRLLVGRAELGRRNGFLSRNAMRLGRVIRHVYGLAAREEATATEVWRDQEARRVTLADLDAGRDPDGRVAGPGRVRSDGEAEDARGLRQDLGRAGRADDAREGEEEGMEAGAEGCEADGWGGDVAPGVEAGQAGHATAMYDGGVEGSFVGADEGSGGEGSGVEELMAAGRRLLEMLPAEDREDVVSTLSQGASPVAAHLLARITETCDDTAAAPPSNAGGRSGAAAGSGEVLLHDLEELIARGRHLVDILGPEAFEALSAAVAQGQSPVAKTLRAGSWGGSDVSPLGSPVRGQDGKV